MYSGLHPRSAPYVLSALILPVPATRQSANPNIKSHHHYPQHRNTQNRIKHRAFREDNTNKPSFTDAWYIISLYPEPNDYEYETIPNDQGENGRVTYYYVDRRPSEEALRQSGPPQNQQNQQPQRGYGTTEGRTMQPPPSQQQGQAVGSSQGGVPPSYEQAVSGDHKVQS